MTTHNEKHESLLLDLFAGDRSEQDLDIQMILSSCAECSEKYNALRFLTSRLDGVGMQQREDMGAGAPSGFPTKLSPVDVHGELERLSRGAAPGKVAVGGKAWLQWSTLAAASVGVFFLVRAMVSGAGTAEGPGRQTYEDLTLGADAESADEALSIRQEAGELHVQWSVSKIAGGSFMLWVYGTGESADQELFASDSLREASLTIPAELVVQWHGKVEVLVQELDASGNDHGSALSRFYSLP